MDGCAPNLNEI
ncbi:hypothetical protein CSUI_010634 [Cystoisospora suis]|uniref:Uncharacterized protein n=1 Tax=Cystoisospora suis TaxID=483139 RepID=A0A2C6KD06_9APIC|nr:hypothetical protein CSUI_010634 [Cystoisospora suis]